MYKYAIIGGATKCATTSLYNYLGSHPNICPSVYKETRFFLNASYPLNRRVPISKNINDYNNLFSGCSDAQIKLEATPDYLFSNNTEKEIRSMLKDALIIFVIRNPIDRLISWYKFGKQMHLLNEKTSFKEYVELMFNKNGLNEQHLLALEQGKYFNYLKKYIDCIGAENIQVLLYDKLINNPLGSVSQICNKLEIDLTFYLDYQFEVHNKTVNIKSSSLHYLFNKIRRQTRKLVNRAPANIRTQLKKPGKKFVANYLSLNTSANHPVDLNNDLKARLKDYYYASNLECENLIGQKTNWNKN